MVANFSKIFLLLVTAMTISAQEPPPQQLYRGRSSVFAPYPYFICDTELQICDNGEGRDARPCHPNKCTGCHGCTPYDTLETRLPNGKKGSGGQQYAWCS
ncbi:hypothetical protein Ptr902_00435 [Pyrenophora tritici-repentis]|nr:hypothetical protein Ptr902_00435 [Pyrenophora tritici-repentis]